MLAGNVLVPWDRERRFLRGRASANQRLPGQYAFGNLAGLAAQCAHAESRRQQSHLAEIRAARKISEDELAAGKCL